MKTIKRGNKIMKSTLQKTEQNTSQQFAVFFHKFGLVRFSLNPGCRGTGIFHFYTSCFLKYSSFPVAAIARTLSINAILCSSESLE